MNNQLNNAYHAWHNLHADARAHIHTLTLYISDLQAYYASQPGFYVDAREGAPQCPAMPVLAPLVYRV